MQAAVPFLAALCRHADNAETHKNFLSRFHDNYYKKVEESPKEYNAMDLFLILNNWTRSPTAPFLKSRFDVQEKARSPNLIYVCVR